MKLLTFLLFVCLELLVDCNKLDRGYPGGYFKYGDRNKDGRIDMKDLQANRNMGWLKEWYWITNNASKNRDIILTEETFNLLITPGIYY